MKKLAAWILALSAVACMADIEQTLPRLTGSEGTAMPSSEAIAAYPAALDYLLPRLADPDTGTASVARNTLTSLALRAGRPGAEQERAALCREIVQRLEVEAPAIVHRDLLELLDKVGREESVSALSKILDSQDLVLREKARQALAANPSPEAAVVLREALADATDIRLKAGLIYALGLRGDESSARAIAQSLSGDNEELAVVATKALAGIGGERVARALLQTRPNVSATVQAAIDDACLDIATGWLEQGEPARAASLFLMITQVDPAPRVRAVVAYGLIRAEPGQATQRIIEGLTDREVAVRTAAAAAARGMGGDALGNELAEALPGLATPSQVAVLDLLGETQYRPAAAAVTALLASDAEEVRVAAARALGMMGHARSIVPLLDLAEAGRAADEKEAERALMIMDAKGVNEALKAAADIGPGPRRAVAIRILAGRATGASAGWLLVYAADEDADVYLAASRALRDVGTGAQLPALADLMVANAARDRGRAYQQTARAILGREADSAAMARMVIEKLNGAGGDATVLLLGLLPSVGGPAALDGVRQELRAGSAAEKEAAVRALAAWNSFDAAQDLLALSTNKDVDAKLRVLALQGVARLAKEADSAAVQDRIRAVQTALKSADRTDLKVALIGAMGQLPDPRAGQVLGPYLADQEVKTETAMALVQVATALSAVDAAAAQSILQEVLESGAANELTETEARALLTKLQGASADYLTEWRIAGPYTGGDLFKDAFAPEENSRNVAWKPLDQRLVDGDMVRFERLPEWRTEKCVVYLSRTVMWPEGGKATLELGSDDAVKVWLNGKLVHANDVERPVRAGSDRVPLDMKKGKNELMVKLVQYAGNWGLSARIVSGQAAPRRRRAAAPAAAAAATMSIAGSGAHALRDLDFNRFPMARPGSYPSKAKGGDRINVLLLTGQMNKYHRWEETTPYLRRFLEATGRFAVDVHTMPPLGSDLEGWNPPFEDYPVVVMNVDGDYWPEKTRKRFENLVRTGKLGLAVVHSSDNAWKNWGEWNEMIAVGGWGGRSPASGPWIRWRDGKMVLEQKNGPSGTHGPRHPFAIDHRTPEHPVTRGLPERWLHHVDELYSCLRGPAKRVKVLGTAFSDPEKKAGTGEHEPMLMAIRFGEGRIFHTTLGHDVESMRCAGFQTTMERGTEWAATGRVTLPKPSDFPSATEPSVRAGAE